MSISKASRSDLVVDLQVGDLALTRRRANGDWEALCACGRKVVRKAHSLLVAKRNGLRAACLTCTAIRAKATAMERRGQSALKALERLSPDERERVLLVANGRTSAEVIGDAIDLVKRGLDVGLRATCRADPFVCTFKHRYSEPL